MQRKYAVAACLIAMVLLFIGTAGEAAITFTATQITGDSYIDVTAATASATALVIGNDVPLFRNAANQLRLQGKLSVQDGGSFNAVTTTDSLYVGGLAQFTGATASATALVLGSDVPLFRSAANRLTVQGGLVANQATSSDSLYVAGLTQLTGATASGTALVIGNDVPLFRSAANTLTLQGVLALGNGETIGNTTNNVIFVNSTTVATATNSATTTPGLWVSSPATTASTTTLIIGGGDEAGETNLPKSCIQMWRGGKSYKVYVASGGTSLVVAPGVCHDN